MAPSTRVPAQPTADEIGAALDRVQTTHLAYSAHLETCEDAMRGHWTRCPELVALDREANAAAYQYGRLTDPLKRGRHLTVVA